MRQRQPETPIHHEVGIPHHNTEKTKKRQENETE